MGLAIRCALRVGGSSSKKNVLTWAQGPTDSADMQVVGTIFVYCREDGCEFRSRLSNPLSQSMYFVRPYVCDRKSFTDKLVKLLTVENEWLVNRSWARKTTPCCTSTTGCSCSVCFPRHLS